MKKILAFLMAALMVTCLTVTALAADKDVEDANVSSAQISQGVVSSGDSDTVVAENENTAAKEALKAAITSTNKKINKTGSVLYIVSVSSASGGTSAKLTFTMPSGQTLSYVLRYDETGSTWQQVDATYSNGVLTVTSPNGLGTIAVVTQSTSQTSPQTGEVTTSVYVACAALMAVAAAAFFIKKAA